MEIKVLGASGSGVRGHSLPSLLIDGRILLDAGGIADSLDLAAQERIEYVFVTHAHLDHVRDIPFLAENVSAARRVRPVIVFARREVIADIRKHILNKKIWPDFTTIPNEAKPIMVLESMKGAVRIDGFLVSPYGVTHTVPATGFLVQKDGKNLFYTGDTGPTRKTWKRLRGRRLDCLIMEISYPDSLKGLALKTGHLSPSLFLEELSHIEPKPQRVFVTHVKTRYRMEIEKEVKAAGLETVHILDGGEIIRI